MQVALYVLRCPEFLPLVAAAQRAGEVSVDDWGDYVRLAAVDVLRFDRTETDLNDAVWFAAATGGIEGRIAEFTHERLEIVADPDSQASE
ncbi:MAG: hypothetical protein AB7U39_24715 [Ilumatobacteraceae bacterium]